MRPLGTSRGEVSHPHATPHTPVSDSPAPIPTWIPRRRATWTRNTIVRPTWRHPWENPKNIEVEWLRGGYCTYGIMFFDF
ncbi:hypothetical protein C8Q79DRAFT_284063 [Trametes meyenii]|nr:hypothetical protein C8Q79DRAFT_284063 [Trametes meyenii]